VNSKPDSAYTRLGTISLIRRGTNVCPDAASSDAVPINKFLDMVEAYLADKTFFLRGANNSAHTTFSELDFVCSMATSR
jgi:hypothetical protein